MKNNVSEIKKRLFFLFTVLFILNQAHSQSLQVGVWNYTRKIVDEFEINDTILKRKNLEPHFKNMDDGYYYLHTSLKNDFNNFTIPYELYGDYFFPPTDSIFNKVMPLDSLSDGPWFVVEKHKDSVIILLEKNIKNYELNGPFIRYWQSSGNIFSFICYEDNASPFCIFYNNDNSVSTIIATTDEKNNKSVIFQLKNGNLDNVISLSNIFPNGFNIDLKMKVNTISP